MTNKEAIRLLSLLTQTMVDPDFEPQTVAAINMGIEALINTSDQGYSHCRERNRCAIYDNFNIDYCSDWRCELDVR